MIDDARALESLGRAWRLLWSRLSNVIVIGIVLVAIGALIALATGLLSALLAMTLTLPSIIDARALAWATALVSGTALLVIQLIAGGGLQAYTSAVWTLAYEDFGSASQPTPAPRLSPNVA
jgi:hypothetical protein